METVTRHSDFLDGCLFPVGEPYFFATLAVLRFTNFIPSSAPALAISP